jgi:hypothetical protein
MSQSPGGWTDPGESSLTLLGNVQNITEVVRS